MPCFVAAYAGACWPPRNEKTEQMLMILPLRWGTIRWAAS